MSVMVTDVCFLTLDSICVNDALSEACRHCYYPRPLRSTGKSVNKFEKDFTSNT